MSRLPTPTKHQDENAEPIEVRWLLVKVSMLGSLFALPRHVVSMSGDMEYIQFQSDHHVNHLT